jgi:uncharacterized protein (UPF0332 family)
MPLPKDLLDQATRLLSHEKKKPKQASIRRAVSTAYYAAFHLLASESAKRMAPTLPKKLGLQVQRAFEHGAMKAVCKSFAGGTLPSFIGHLQSGSIEPDLQKLASHFVKLQEARHAADDDLVHTLTKQEAEDNIDKAKEVFAIWKTISKLPHSNVFLMSLALPQIGRWRKE